MIFDISYWTKVIKNIIYVIALLLGIYVFFNLSIFYMPFLIAFVISIIIEPCIKYIMKYTKLTRRTSSIIIFVIFLIILLFILSWLFITIFSESSNLLSKVNNYFDIGYLQIQNLIDNINIEQIHIQEEIVNVIDSSSKEILTSISSFITKALNKLINIVTSIPYILICIGITILALYFICVDKIYIIDQLEHHTPKIWIKRIKVHFDDLIISLRRIFKSTANINICIVFNMLDRFIYF